VTCSFFKLHSRYLGAHRDDSASYILTHSALREAGNALPSARAGDHSWAWPACVHGGAGVGRGAAGIRDIRYAVAGTGAILGQQFLERLPIVLFPSRRQAFRRALGKACVVKNDLGA